MPPSGQNNTITRVDDFSQVDEGQDERIARDAQGMVITESLRERALIVGAEIQSDPGVLPLEDSLDELALLAHTAGLDVTARLTQRLPAPNPASFIGSGKVQELVSTARDTGAQVVIFDIELSPRQLRVLESALGQNTKVIDRTALILDIFAKHARTREGIVQVELAQYEYRLPRLTRAWTHLARQAGGRAGGGVGVRGPGETQLEMDRRQITRRIAKLNADLQDIRSHRMRSSARQSRDPAPRLGLVGYTNAGKSSLLNQITRAGAYADDLLFATLDPITRQFMLANGQQALLTDTVGFIQKLPTSLVAAFRATLEVVNDAQILLHVVDISQTNQEEHITVVEEVLDNLGAGRTPMILVLNKIDRLPADCDPLSRLPAGCSEPYVATVPVSAMEGTGIDQLIRVITQALAAQMDQVSVMIPYERGDLVSLFHQYGHIEQETYGATGTSIHGRVPTQVAVQLATYSVN